ncbi:MAG: hypothetical protein COZ56_17760 [Armatimonadetes bacterium CG_4_8_14_3_um_filter_58_9]|nr:MAG: hypothetical protein COZ56_17760 [Armatimonadetes bacterium CG_4_8_14_3_um_filter_58_9]
MKEDMLFVVVEGEYSDYRIVGIYNDKELAKRLTTFLKDTEIEEYPLNPHEKELKSGLWWYRVTLEQDGSVRYVDSNPLEADHKELWHWEADSLNAVIGTCGVLAKNREDAIKIADERRRQSLVKLGVPELAIKENTT